MLRRFIRSTRGRLTLVTGVIFALAVVISDVGLTVGLTYVEQSDFNDSLHQQADLVAGGLELSPSGYTYRGGEPPAETTAGLAISAAVVGPSGVVLESDGQPLIEARLLELAAPAIRSGRPISYEYGFVDVHGVSREAYARPVEIRGTRLAVITSRSTAAVQSQVGRTDRLIGGASLLALLLGFVVPYLVAGRILRPVREMSDLARTLGDRDLHRRLEVKTEDELGELAGTLNGMLSRLEKSVTALRRFTADASHELRTPLALMQSELDLALHHRHTPEDERLLRVLRAEVGHMAGITAQLLLLARADAATLTAHPEPVDVADFVHETAARWTAVARAAAVRLRVDGPDSGVISTDPALTRQVLDNLVENAIRHSPRGGTVSVAAARADGDWIFRVSDQGKGVPPEERDRIFDRFARVEVARDGDGTHAGLGLALCAALAGVLGGRVRLVGGAAGANGNGKAKGAVFELRLPARR